MVFVVYVDSCVVGVLRLLLMAFVVGGIVDDGDVDEEDNDVIMMTMIIVVLLTPGNNIHFRNLEMFVSFTREFRHYSSPYMLVNNYKPVSLY